MQLVMDKDKGLKTVKDLKGKTITVLAYQDTTYFALLGMLASQGMTKEEVVRAIGVPESASAEGNTETLYYVEERPWWQWVMRGAFLLFVVVVQSRLQRRIAHD